MTGEFRNVIWGFSGYRESYRHVCGSELLYRRLRIRNSADTLVRYDAWDFDPKGVGAFIRRHSEPDVRIVLWGYSYGGHQAVEVAVALRGQGLAVHHLILCDAVYRPTSIVPFNVRSLTRLARIRLPENVMNYTWLRQRRNRPAGHDVTAPHLSPRPAIVLDRTHTQMDEAPEFHEVVEAAVGSFS